MNIKIVNTPKIISATLDLPASKSISNRVLIIRAVCGSYFKINNLSESNDTKILLKMLSSQSNLLDAEDAGTAARFMTALAASTFGEWVITGTERMKQRPTGPLVDCLKVLGASIEYMENHGFPPLKIKGVKLKGREITIPGNISSQFVSALLMIAPYVMDGLKINISGTFYSRPYVLMTLKLLEYFGVKYARDKNTISIKEQEYKPREYTVEPDWSAASYWYEIAALSENADIMLTGLKKSSIQGDRVISDVFEQLGVKTTSIKNGVKLTKIPVLSKSFHMDCSDYPDIVPALSVTLSVHGIPFLLTGLGSLRVKESDRLAVLQKELARTGVMVQVTDNSMKWDGNTCEIGPLSFDTYNDHRIAMAFAPVSMKHKNVMVNDTDVVRKSYPSFWDDLSKAGFRLE